MVDGGGDLGGDEGVLGVSERSVGFEGIGEEVVESVHLGLDEGEVG